MLTTIVVLIVLLWLLGFATHIGGGLIHLLLIVALVIFIADLIQRRSPPL
jgi:hypothetical protein